MVEINLLPWREYHRARWRSWKKLSWVSGIVAGVCLLMGIASMFWHATPEVIQAQPILLPDNNTLLLQDLQKTKYIGFLQQGKHVLGIIKLVDGEVRDIQVGSLLKPKVKVSRLSATELWLELPQHISLKILFTHS